MQNLAKFEQDVLKTVTKRMTQGSAEWFNYSLFVEGINTEQAEALLTVLRRKYGDVIMSEEGSDQNFAYDFV